MSAPDVSMPTDPNGPNLPPSNLPMPTLAPPAAGSTDDLENQSLASITGGTDTSAVQTNDAPPDNAPAQPSLWRRVLGGALQGLAAGASVNTRGMSAGSAFAAGAGSGANQILNVVPKQQQEANTEAAKQAFYHANTAKIMYDLHKMSAEDENAANAAIDKHADEDASLMKAGALQPLTTPTDSVSAMQQLQAAMKQRPADMLRLSPTVDAQGNRAYQVVRVLNSPIQQDVDITDRFGNKQTVEKGSVTGQALDQFRMHELATGLDMKQAQEAQAAKIAGQKEVKATTPGKAAASDSTDWLPKVSADEKKKTELAENIAFNANEVASIIQRRPDLFGPAAGRITNIQQMTGNNDPDISALATHIHNMAMANSGVHGFRSQEGVQSYENQLLNNFHNGPKAVAGALRASVGSVQTFIDNARPRAYRTHSANGGAIRGMMNQGGK